MVLVFQFVLPTGFVGVIPHLDHPHEPGKDAVNRMPHPHFFINIKSVFKLRAEQVSIGST